MLDQLHELRERVASLESKVGQLTVENLNLINALVQVIRANNLRANIAMGVGDVHPATKVLEDAFDRLFVMAGGEEPDDG